MFLAALTDETRRTHERILREAIARAGQTLDQAAREADIDPKQFTRQLQLVEGSHKRLAMQPKAFWQWLAVGLADTFGLPQEVKQAYRLHRRARSFKRMARMTMAPQQRERQSA